MEFDKFFSKDGEKASLLGIKENKIIVITQGGKPCGVYMDYSRYRRLSLGREVKKIIDEHRDVIDELAK